MLHPVFLALLGVFVGVFSGLMGLGGGAVMIPLMVLLLGLTQQQAQGTSLAVMLPPVALPAIIAYWNKGNVRLDVALWMCIGVAVGSYFGGYIANSLSRQTMQAVFGLLLVYVACYTMLGKEHMVRTLLLSACVVMVAGAMLLATRYIDARAVAASPSTAPAAAAAPTQAAPTDPAT